MDLIEQNIILYYADFLSLKEISRTVTDNCKYYFIHKAPINLAYLQNSEPFYDVENKYYKQAYQECKTIKDSMGETAVLDFVSNIGNLAVMGCIDDILMLKQIHQFSTKSERKQAFKDYQKFKNSQYYTHLIIDENGDKIRRKCTRYIAHYERNTWQEPNVHYEGYNNKLGVPRSTKKSN